MEFFGDPQEEKLRAMQEFLRLWAWSQKERKRTGINPLYSLMVSVRNAEEEIKRIEQKALDNNPNAARRGLTLGKPIPMTRNEKQLIAHKVDSIMNDPELWRGHYRDKEVLAKFYLDSSANPKGCNESVKLFSRSMHVPRWQVKNMIRSALLYFSMLYGE
ncbi:MAG TPA: hypothetical protein IAC66_07475 [Candidatus Aphodousia gallistercoris]|nr:hypothetical protein [Candidatus Aphodousia gallistercoris]